MKRRDFLSALGPLAATPFFLNGLPVRAMSPHSPLHQMAMLGDNDRAIVLVQLHGGNDGLNMVIPMEQYSIYNNLRPGLAIPDSGARKFIELDPGLSVADQAGLHPDMSDLKALYDAGKVNVVQGVTYPNTNLSHFRGRDIWFMGGGYSDFYSSGWMGRYLEFIFPDFPDLHPNANMPDPLGLEIGAAVSTGFSRDSGIPAAIALEDPVAFHDLINGVGGALPPSISGTHFGEELAYIQGIEQKSNAYADRLKAVFENGSNSPNVTYPDAYPFTAPAAYAQNPLAWQLELVARLLAGGIKTKIFLVRLGRFDTHNDQVQAGDPTMGGHAALLYHLATSLKAFQDDLKNLGIEDRVLTMTFSEFGRRPNGNGSLGTDHGTAAPMIVVGKGVKGGMTGTNPDLNDLDSKNNLKMQADYRDVFIDVLGRWMGADQATLDYTFFGRTPNPGIDLIENSYVTDLESPAFAERTALYPVQPNPVSDVAQIRYYLAQPGEVEIQLQDMQGRPVKSWQAGPQARGAHNWELDLHDVSAGTYVYRLQTNGYEAARKLVKK